MVLSDILSKDFYDILEEYKERVIMHNYHNELVKVTVDTSDTSIFTPLNLLKLSFFRTGQPLVLVADRMHIETAELISKVCSIPVIPVNCKTRMPVASKNLINRSYIKTFVDPYSIAKYGAHFHPRVEIASKDCPYNCWFCFAKRAKTNQDKDRWINPDTLRNKLKELFTFTAGHLNSIVFQGTDPGTAPTKWLEEYFRITKEIGINQVSVCTTVKNFHKIIRAAEKAQVNLNIQLSYFPGTKSTWEEYKKAITYLRNQRKTGEYVWGVVPAVSFPVEEFLRDYSDIKEKTAVGNADKQSSADIVSFIWMRNDSPHLLPSIIDALSKLIYLSIKGFFVPVIDALIVYDVFKVNPGVNCQFPPYKLSNVCVGTDGMWYGCDIASANSYNPRKTLNEFFFDTNRLTKVVFNTPNCLNCEYLGICWGTCPFVTNRCALMYVTNKLLQNLKVSLKHRYYTLALEKARLFGIRYELKL